MTHIDDLFDREQLNKALEAGLIRRQEHPDLPRRIYNYTQRAVVTPGAWDNPAVLACRGLITDYHDRVIARPFPKFFNYGEPNGPDFNPFQSNSCEAFDKIDGSLGILYHTGHGTTLEGIWYSPEYAIATRGSFTSEQALHATQVWQERYQDRWQPPPDFTALFEIVYPENRIVLDYGDFDDLVLLGMVQITTGKIVGPKFLKWKGPTPELLPYHNILSAIKAPPRENSEGMVLYITAKQLMIKIKQEDYVQLHRIVTGLNERAIWEHLSTKPIKELIDQVPEEFHPWIHEVSKNLFNELNQTYDDALAEYNRILNTLGEVDPQNREQRKAFAEHAVKSSTLPSYLFALLDGKDMKPMIWKTLKPEATRTQFQERAEIAA